MDELLFVALLAIASLIISIVVAAQFGKLRSTVAELRRRIAVLESGKTVIPPPPVPVVPLFPTETERPSLRTVPPPLPTAQTVTPGPAINWESVLGVKLFAWVGGLALFLGVVFFVRYAFENNLITPGLRVLGGAAIGTLLVIIGALPAVRRYSVPAQSVSATGIVSLYASIYAAYAFYNLMPLSGATALMWVVTAVALVLATRLDVQSVAWLGALGGFLTPALLWRGDDNAVALFGYVAVLNLSIAAVALLKRWNYLVLVAAVGTVVMEFAGAPARADLARNVVLAMEAEFFVICMLTRRLKNDDRWAIGATVLTGFAVFAFCVAVEDYRSTLPWAFAFPVLLLANAGLIGLAVRDPAPGDRSKALAAIIGAALVATWLVEWHWHARVLVRGQPLSASGCYVALFLLFAATPYLCGVTQAWPWIIAAIAGPMQFWFVHHLVAARGSHPLIGLLPLAFAIPAAAGIAYLFKRQHVDLASGDSRLASQGAAVLAFVSLILPVQFEREWITLGWALEGVALILLFRWIPNHRLRAAALIVFAAALVRLVFNPAVFQYHPRSGVLIMNWYFYTYGLAAACFFAGARWFGEPRDRPYERKAPYLLDTAAGVVAFLLMNIEIADYFSIGPTLTFSFSGNFARDMTYTIAWALFALALLAIGIAGKTRPVRLAGIALLCCALAKLFLHDLDALSQLYRIGAFFAVAIIAIVASFAYQRFLSPVREKT